MKTSQAKPVLREIRASDCQAISDAFAAQRWKKPAAQYHQYLQYQEEGKRDVIIATLAGVFTGYLTIKWESDYVSFKEKKIPEIVDFNVLKKYQRRGIGTALMDEAETRIKKVSNYAGIGFGVTQDYGAAQILYINRLYKPDGQGLAINSTPVKNGDIITINDSLAFHLTKKL